MIVGDIKWSSLKPTKALKCLPRGTLVLWRHDYFIELVEAFETDGDCIVVSVLGPGSKKTKIVRNFKDDAVCVL